MGRLEAQTEDFGGLARRGLEVGKSASQQVGEDFAVVCAERGQNRWKHCPTPANSGHEVVVSVSTNPTKLALLAGQIGARAATPDVAAARGQVIVLSVPWATVDAAIREAGGPVALAGKIVLDTTNQFGCIGPSLGVLDLGGSSAAETNAAKAPAAMWVEAFNTLTAGFQSESAGRAELNRVVMFYGSDSDTAVPTVEALIDAAGFDPVRTGRLVRTEVGHQEPKGELHGEEFRREEAFAAVTRLRGTAPTGLGRP